MGASSIRGDRPRVGPRSDSRAVRAHRAPRLVPHAATDPQPGGAGRSAAPGDRGPVLRAASTDGGPLAMGRRAAPASVGSRRRHRAVNATLGARLGPRARLGDDDRCPAARTLAACLGLPRRRHEPRAGHQRLQRRGARVGGRRGRPHGRGISDDAGARGDRRRRRVPGDRRTRDQRAACRTRGRARSRRKRPRRGRARARDARDGGDRVDGDRHLGRARCRIPAELRRGGGAPGAGLAGMCAMVVAHDMSDRSHSPAA